MSLTKKKVIAGVSIVAVSCATLYIYLLLSKTPQPHTTDQSSVAHFKTLNGLGQCALFTPRNHVEGMFAPLRCMLKT